MYGLYRSYRQIYDNPLLIDPLTAAYDHFKPGTSEWSLDDSDDSDFSLQNSNLANKFSASYREVYYSFQHPYFIGYLLFWFLILSSKTIYLGISNFS